MMSSPADLVLLSIVLLGLSAVGGFLYGRRKH